MRFLIALLLSVSAWAQITGSPASLSFYQRQGYNYPLNGTVAPVTQAITLTGSGAWTAVRSGGLMTDCDGSPCFTISAASGSGSGSINVVFSGAIETLAVGSFTGAVTINGSSVVSLTLTVQPHEPYYAFGYKAGYPSGCTGPAAGYGTPETCTITNERPLSNSFSVPTVGNTYVDPQFGSTVRRGTPGGQQIQYGALSAFSATGQYILTSDPSANVDVYTVATGTEAYGNVSGPNINFSAWDPSDDNKLWFMDGVSIKYRNLSAGTTTTAATYGAGITMGGTVDITDDGWWAFHDYTDLCAVNLNGLTTGTQSAKTFCISLAAYFPAGDIDFTQITQVDSESGKRYVVVIGLPANQVFSVGTSGLTYEYALSVSGQPHSDVGQDEKGRQIFFWNWDDPAAGPKTYLASLQLNKGADMWLPVEIGGGLRLITLDYSAGSTDGHFGCNWRGVCVFSPYGNSGGITAKLIQSVTAATPCQIGSTGHGYTTGNSVLIGGAAGITSINGVFTVTSTGANTYTLDGHTCAGTYTASSGNSTLNVATAADAPYRQEIWTVSMGGQVNRVAPHRAKLYDNGSTLTSYFNTPRCSINRAGDKVACESNMGVPELPSVWVFDTGITSTQRLKIAVSPADSEAVLSYVFSAGFTVGTAAIEISTKPDPSDSPTVDVLDGLSSQARQYIATGLTAGTQYYYRVCSLGFCDTGQFRTAPSLSGTGRLQIAKGGGGSISWGYTTGMTETPCTSPCDLAATRGLVYHNATGVPSATVVR